jgi:pimeloyl-ACP methyl ester carboxylesterase
MLRAGLALAIGCLLITATFAQQPIDIGAAPGRLIDIGGRPLHFICSGSGSPTVLLEAGASSFAIDWTLVQPEIARATRVCAYDRAGHGWSSARTDADTPARVVADLEKALQVAGEKPPYVMVGASFGAMYVRLYQLDHPSDVAGFVFVDPATEDRLFTMLNGRVVTIAEVSAEDYKATLPTSGAVPIRPRKPQTGAPFDRLPPDLYRTRIRLDQRLIATIGSSVPAEIVSDSQEGSRAAFARLLQNRSHPDAPIKRTPVVVLTRGSDMSDGLAENHAQFAKLSANSRHTVVPNAGHEIHLFAPAVVVRAIQDVVKSVREKSQLSQ